MRMMTNSKSSVSSALTQCNARWIEWCVYNDAREGSEGGLVSGQDNIRANQKRTRKKGETWRRAEILGGLNEHQGVFLSPFNIWARTHSVSHTHTIFSWAHSSQDYQQRIKKERGNCAATAVTILPLVNIRAASTHRE